jgi:hypothetical protein
MRYAPRALLAGGLGFAVSFIVACGGGAGLLAGNQASTLNGQLDRVSAAVDSGQCARASSAAASLKAAIRQLPQSTKHTLVKNLNQGATTVAELAQRDCTASTPARTTPTTSTKTTPTNTNTTPTSPATTPTQTQTNPPTGPTTSTGPPATTPTGPGTTSDGSTSGGAGVGGGPASGGSGGGSGQ